MISTLDERQKLLDEITARPGDMLPPHDEPWAHVFERLRNDGLVYVTDTGHMAPGVG